MMYSAIIPMSKIIESGLADKTDFNDWVILLYIYNWEKSGNGSVFEGHNWLNYAHLLKEVPMLSVRTKSGVSNRIKKLKKLGLLSTVHDTNKRLFVKYTDLYIKVVVSDDIYVPHEQGVHTDEQGVHTDEQGVHTDEQGVHTDEQGVHTDEQGVHTDEHILNNQLLNNQYQSTTTCEDNFKIDLDWVPDESTLKISLFKAGGFDYKNIDPAWLVEFCLYWSSTETKFNQARWTGKFIQKCVSYFRDPELFDQQQGGWSKKVKNTETFGLSPPDNDNALISWMRQNGFGDGPSGMGFGELRGWLRRQIENKEIKQVG